MREIKFRAWDSVANRFTKNLVINHDGTLKAKRFDGSLTRADKAERFDIQLFTGLLDKNGKEIYEGDILTVIPMRGNDNKGDKGEVYYYQGQWWLGNPEYSGYHLPKMINYGQKDSDNSSTYIGNVVEVIGNIWENPELLNEK